MPVPSSSDPGTVPVGGSSAPVHPELGNYPELKGVLSLAVAAVATAYGMEQESDPGGVAVLEQAAVAAMVEFYAPAAAAAARMAAAVDQAQADRAAAVACSAEEVAARADMIAAALQVKGDQADDASVPEGGQVEASEQSSRALDEAGAAIAARRAVLVSVVRESVQADAAAVAAAAQAAAITVGTEKNTAAANVRLVALSTCYQVALVAAAYAADSLCTG